MQIPATILAFLFIASANGFPLFGSEPRFNPAPKEDAVPDKYIVVMKPGLSEESINSHKEQINTIQKGFKDQEAFSKNSGIIHDFDILGEVKGYTGYFAQGTIDELKKLKDVELIQQDIKVAQYEVTTQKKATWGLARLSSKHGLNGIVDGDYVYHSEGGAGVTAYIIDSGILTEHSDFEGRATWGMSIPSDNHQDTDGHGTGCAGIVGSKHYGVAKKVDLVAVKAFEGSFTGTASDTIKAIEWTVKDAESRKGKPGFKGAVANLAFGVPKNEALNMVVNAAAKSLVITVAAGNGDENRFEQDACKYSPASAEGVITVGSIDNNDRKSWWSNYGKCVDIYAPGSDIFTTSANSGIKYMSGTSVSASFVSGLAAYFMSLQPNSGSDFSGSTLNTAQMKKALIAFGHHGALHDTGIFYSNVLAYNGAGEDLSKFYSAL